MKQFLRRRWIPRGLFAILIMMGLATEASAHPHAWIDIRVTVLFDKAGRIFALRQNWMFDPLYTAFVLEGFQDAKGKAPARRKMDDIMRENLENLKEYNYFTEVEAKSKKAKFTGVRDTKSDLVGKRLSMSFTLLLESPVDATTHPVSYSVYDPTFYIEILHAEKGTAVKLANAGVDCRHRLHVPKPNPEAVALAAALDRTQSAGDGLGKFFAETVTIRCGTQQ